MFSEGYGPVCRFDLGFAHLALQLPFMELSESMGNHDSDIVDADGVG